MKPLQKHIHFSFFLIAWALLTPITLLSKGTVVLFLNKYHTPILDEFMFYVTHLGDGLIPLIIIPPLLFKNRKKAIEILIGYALTGLLVQILKRTFSIVRPSKFIEHFESLHLVDGTEVLKYNSFPSGHSAIAFFLLFTILYNVRNSFIQVIAIITFSLAAISRVYLTHHFFIDIWVGAFIAFLCFNISLLISQKLEK